MIGSTELSSLVSLFRTVLGGTGDLNLSSKQIWAPLLFEIDPSCGKSTSRSLLDAFAEPRAKLQKMSSTLDLLKSLSGSLEKEILDLKSRVGTAALHRALQSVPNEVVSLIAGHAVSKFEDARTLSHVCKRFRSIVLSSPRIWAGITLTANMCPDLIASIVNRSRGLLLKAEIDFSLFGSAGTSNVLLHSSRLNELRVVCLGTWVTLEFRRQFKTVHLPHLRNLQLSTWFDSSVGHMCEFWTVPELQSLEADYIPLPKFGSNLIRCHITIDRSTPDGLLDFLASAPLIEELKLAFLYTTDTPETRTEAVALPNLKSLGLTVDVDVGMLIVHSILDKLCPANLSDLNVVIERDDSTLHFGPVSIEDLEECIILEIAIFPFISKLRSLRCVDISVQTQPFGIYTVGIFGYAVELLDDPVDTLMGSLQVCTRYDTITLSLPCRSLRIEGVEELTVEILHDCLCDSLCVNPGLRRVEVMRCPEIDEDDLRTLFPNAVVTYDR